MRKAIPALVLIIVPLSVPFIEHALDDPARARTSNTTVSSSSTTITNTTTTKGGGMVTTSSTTTSTSTTVTIVPSSESDGRAPLVNAAPQ